MEPYGYYPVPSMTGLWAHRMRKIFFWCVDNFGVKYFSKDDVDHLLKYFSKHYTVLTDWEGPNYLGLTIDCNYREGSVDISMPKYVKNALGHIQHPKQKLPQYAPRQLTVPAYGRQLQIAPDPD